MPSLPSSSHAERHFTPSYHDYRYDSTAQQDMQEPTAPESTSIDRDDELLNFQTPNYNFTLLDTSLRKTYVSLNARLHGMFFMADHPSGMDIFPPMNPPELTCYRRNLFQVTGSITIPRDLHFILTDRGDRIPIVAQELTISATESVESGTVKLISVPWKTPINSPPIPPEEKIEKEPNSIPLDPMSHHDPNIELTTYPFAWKRLQFRIATANNGRRKELQQHFVAHLKLVATLSTGDRVVIAEARSAAIIVRGRSPRNFERRKDHPVGERAIGRKGTSLPTIPTGVGRRTSSDPPKPSPSLKRERSPDNNFPSFDLGSIPSSQDIGSLSAWPRHTSGSNSAPAFPTPTFRTPTLPSSKSPASASPVLNNRRPSYPHPDEPDSKRPRPGPSKSPRVSTPTQHSPQQHYKYASVPPNVPSTRQLPSTQSSPTPTPEIVTSGDCFYGYPSVVTQPWQPTYTTMSMNPVYTTPYLPHSSMTITASAIGVPTLPAGVNALQNAVTK